MQFPKQINFHIVFLIAAAAIVAIIIFRFLNWGDRVNLDDFADEYTGEYSDTLDSILPVLDEEGNVIHCKGPATIVCFGNAPFADDRDSEDNLANLIAARTGATVYNCSVSGSYLAAHGESISTSTAPIDIFNFFWLTLLPLKTDLSSLWNDAEEVMGADTPPETWEVYNTLTTLDFQTVDVVVIMYDASDYLAGHPMYSDRNDADIRQFTGNLTAGIDLLQKNFPHIRFIVMSPAYAFAVDDSGNYVSSDMYTYGWDVLSTYVIKESNSCADLGVTFIDHIYGTIHEDNAGEYLKDNLHLNAKGRKLVADRFVKALQYFD